MPYPKDVETPNIDQKEKELVRLLSLIICHLSTVCYFSSPLPSFSPLCLPKQKKERGNESVFETNFPANLPFGQPGP